MTLTPINENPDFAEGAKIGTCGAVQLYVSQFAVRVLQIIDAIN
jgi:hypothetical protein